MSFNLTLFVFQITNLICSIFFCKEYEQHVPIEIVCSNLELYNRILAKDNQSFDMCHFVIALEKKITHTNVICLDFCVCQQKIVLFLTLSQNHLDNHPAMLGKYLQTFLLDMVRKHKKKGKKMFVYI